MLGVLQSEFLHAQHLVEEEEEKRDLVLNALTLKLSEEDALKSEFPDLVYLATALGQGQKLEAELIAGGKTNYSFRIFVEQQEEDRSKSVYVKLFLPHALWDTEKNYKFDIARAASEFEILKLLHEQSNNKKVVVVTPYMLLDAETAAAAAGGVGCKLLVAQWATGREEQWANQFIEGQVDLRVVPKVAQALARINSIQVESTFNDSVRHNVLIIPTMVKTAFAQMVIVPEDDCDALMKLFKQSDQDTFDAIVDAYTAQIQTARECLCHLDPHPFNILVEPKRDDVDQPFGPDASFVVCDWEMALMGPLGKDAGTFMAYPAACALCLAAQGHKDEAHELVYATIQFWESYAATLMEEDPENEDKMRNTYRVVLGAQGAYQLFYLYILGVLADTLPLEGVPGKQAATARAAIGVVGWKLLRAGLDDFCDEGQMDLKGLQEYYKETMTTQINELVEYSSSEKYKPRRASFLRHLHRRVTDASAAEEAANRVCSQALDWSYHKRVTLFDKSDDFGASMASFIDDDEDIEVTDEMRREFFHNSMNSMDGLDDSGDLQDPE